LGNPSDFGEESKEEQPRTETTAESNKKLYRNPNNKMLGGVCSGVAAFFGFGATITRLIVLVLTCLWGTGILLYLLLWLIVPEAKTAEQQLEMHGETVNLENIGKVLADNSKAVGDDIKNAYRKVDNNGCLATFLKICLIGLGLVVGLPILFALAIIIITLSAVLLGISTGFLGGFIPFSTNTLLIVQHPELATIGLCFLIGIPLISILYAITSTIFKWKPVNRYIKITGLVLWIASIVMLGLSGWKTDWKKLRDKESWHIGFTNWTEIKGDGNIVERTFNGKNLLTALEVGGGFEVEVIEDSTINNDYIVVIQTDSNIFANLIIAKNKNELIIKNKNRGLRPTKNILLKIRKNTLQYIDLSGAITLIVSDKWRPANAKFNLSGSSEIKVYDVETNNLTFDVSGASDIAMAGKAKYAYYDISGASEIKNDKLLTDSIVLDISGASTINVNPVNYLGGKASGASEINYYTTPKTLKVKTSGASEIAKK
jgi:phage shock protein PspC (stress-responsive transcriptional regulator)